MPRPRAPSGIAPARTPRPAPGRSPRSQAGPPFRGQCRTPARRAWLPALSAERSVIPRWFGCQPALAAEVLRQLDSGTPFGGVGDMHSKEIEDLLSEHPGAAEAAVVAAPSPLTGEPAVVVPRPVHSSSAARIEALLRASRRCPGSW